MIPVKIGAPQAHGGLTLFPLLAVDDAGDPGGPGPDGPATAVGWTLLEDALEAGTLEVMEVGDGVVGELVAVNRGPDPVLILDGEQLIGAKQNRTTGRTILIAASSETRIPVSCMEQGRWRHVSRTMRHGGQHSPSSVRRHARRVEAEAGGEPGDASTPRRRRGPHRDARRASSPSELLSMAQGDVWDTIAESSRRSGVRSATGALDDVYAGRRESIEGRVARFPAEPDQVGLLALVNGAPAGLDLLPGGRVYARVHGRLVRAYLFEALDAAVNAGDAGDAGGAGGGPAPPIEAELADAESFLAAALDARRHPLETAGLGRYAALAGVDVVGGELAVEGAVVHLSAFNDTD